MSIITCFLITGTYCSPSIAAQTLMCWPSQFEQKDYLEVAKNSIPLNGKQVKKYTLTQYTITNNSSELITVESIAPNSTDKDLLKKGFVDNTHYDNALISLLKLPVMPFIAVGKSLKVSINRFYGFDLDSPIQADTICWLFIFGFPVLEILIIMPVVYPVVLVKEYVNTSQDLSQSFPKDKFFLEEITSNTIKPIDLSFNQLSHRQLKSNEQISFTVLSYKKIRKYIVLNFENHKNSPEHLLCRLKVN